MALQAEASQRAGWNESTFFQPLSTLPPLVTLDPQGHLCSESHSGGLRRGSVVSRVTPYPGIPFSWVHDLRQVAKPPTSPASALPAQDTQEGRPTLPRPRVSGPAPCPSSRQFFPGVQTGAQPGGGLCQSFWPRERVCPHLGSLPPGPWEKLQAGVYQIPFSTHPALKFMENKAEKTEQSSWTLSSWASALGDQLAGCTWRDLSGSLCVPRFPCVQGGSELRWVTVPAILPPGGVTSVCDLTPHTAVFSLV